MERFVVDVTGISLKHSDSPTGTDTELLQQAQQPAHLELVLLQPLNIAEKVHSTVHTEVCGRRWRLASTHTHTHTSPPSPLFSLTEPPAPCVSPQVELRLQSDRSAFLQAPERVLDAITVRVG
jgi:hypothetical protein